MISYSLGRGTEEQLRILTRDAEDNSNVKQTTKHTNIDGTTDEVTTGL